jgi:hypothetical protein
MEGISSHVALTITTLSEAAMADSSNTRTLSEIAQALDRLVQNLSARLAEAERLAAAQPALIARSIRRARS